MLERQRVERRTDRQHVGLAVVTHEIESEAVDVIVAHPRDNRVDHDLLGHRMLGRHVLAAGGGLDRAGGVQPLVVAGHNLVQDRGVSLTAGRGVVEHLVQHHPKAVGVQTADHRAELRHPRTTIGCSRTRGVGAFRGHPVERVVAPVERILGSDSRHALLLLFAVRCKGRQVAGRLELLGRVLLDRGDVKRRQEVDGVESRGCQCLQMLGAVPVVREREIGAAVCNRDRRVVDREVAHVQLVDSLVDALFEYRTRVALPESRFQRRVVEIDGNRASGVQRQRDGVRVGDQVGLDLAGGGGKDDNLEEVSRASPLGAGIRPP